MAERLKAAVLKIAVRETVPGVRIPLPPPAFAPVRLTAFLGALGSGQHQRYVDDIQSLGRAETIDDGNGILGHILGSKDVSRQVARQASLQSGVGAEILKKMLPVLATLLMGALAKGQLGGSATQPGSGLGQEGRGGGSILDMLGPLLGGGSGGGGNPMVTDVIGMLGKMLGGGR